MSKLSTFLREVRITTLETENKVKLVVSQFKNEITLHVSGNVSRVVRLEAEYASPNTIARETCHTLGVELTSDQIVAISNWVE